MSLEPVIGFSRARQPQIHDVNVQAVVSCACSPGVPLVIHSTRHIVTCSRCHNAYQIGEFHLTPHEQGMAIQVKIAMREPTILPATQMPPV